MLFQEKRLGVLFDMLRLRYTSLSFWVSNEDCSDWVDALADLSHLSLVVRKPVFRVFDLVRHKPGCTATEDG